jgi:hypothetical protein
MKRTRLFTNRGGQSHCFAPSSMRKVTSKWQIQYKNRIHLQ